MLGFIQFDPSLGLWSPFTFWTVVISVILTLGFTVVVFFGGLSDLRYLLKSMDEEAPDDSDDGRAVAVRPSQDDQE
jgi:hypothetical protein